MALHYPVASLQASVICVLSHSSACDTTFPGFIVCGDVTMPGSRQFVQVQNAYGYINCYANARRHGDTDLAATLKPSAFCSSWKRPAPLLPPRWRLHASRSPRLRSAATTARSCLDDVGNKPSAKSTAVIANCRASRILFNLPVFNGWSSRLVPLAARRSRYCQPARLFYINSSSRCFCHPALLPANFIVGT